VPEATVYRVQDRTGRGPFRPGLTSAWSDRVGMARPPPSFSVWPDLGRLIPGGWWAGSALERVEQVPLWFTGTELAVLAEMGFQFVALPRCLVVARTPEQLLVARKRPPTGAHRVLPWPGGSRT
jgi:hypothetical protein